MEEAWRLEQQEQEQKAAEAQSFQIASKESFARQFAAQKLLRRIAAQNKKPKISQSSTELFRCVTSTTFMSVARQLSATP